MVSSGTYAGSVATNVPIGTMLPWLKDYTNTPVLPDGWVECDGSAISDAASPYNGQNSPDMQTAGLFLRSAATSGGTGGFDTSPTTVFDARTGSSTNNVTVQSSADNRPAFYETVMIMRIK